MFIQDIEFIDPLSQKDLNSDLAVTGGASAVATTKADTDDGDVIYAGAKAEATGDYSKAITKTRAKLKKKGKKSYKSGYVAAYGAAYGADRYGSFEKDMSASFAAL